MDNYGIIFEFICNIYKHFQCRCSVMKVTVHVNVDVDVNVYVYVNLLSEMVCELIVSVF